MKTIMIIGHTGFIGSSFVRYLNNSSENYKIIGIAKNELNEKPVNSILEEYLSLSDYNQPSQKIDFVFFLAHAQNSSNPIDAEEKLKQDFMDMLNRNRIECPLVLILSAGTGTDHLNSRVKFNNDIIKSVKNKVIEVRSSAIASSGSTPYEIPYRCVKKLNSLPAFPWYENKLSITTIENILDIFQGILNGDLNSPQIPKHKTITYQEYIIEIAKNNNKKIKFINIPFNEFRITPYIVSKITNMDYYLVRNLMHSLSVNSVLD